MENVFTSKSEKKFTRLAVKFHGLVVFCFLLLLPPSQQPQMSCLLLDTLPNSPWSLSDKWLGQLQNQDSPLPKPPLKTSRHKSSLSIPEPVDKGTRWDVSTQPGQRVIYILRLGDEGLTEYNRHKFDWSFDDRNILCRRFGEKHAGMEVGMEAKRWIEEANAESGSDEGEAQAIGA